MEKRTRVTYKHHGKSSFFKNNKDLKIGEYFPYTHEPGVEEFCGKPVKAGTVYWTVRLDKESWFDTLSQGEAIIISELIKINRGIYKKMINMEHESATNPNALKTYKVMWDELKKELKP